MDKKNNPVFLRSDPSGASEIVVGRMGRTYETSNRVNISKEHNSMSLKAARVVAEAVRSFAPSDEKPYLNIGLSTGGGSIGMYGKLIDMCIHDGLDFSRVNFFNLDEYVGLPPDHPQSYNSEMHKNFFDRIPAPLRPHSINIPDGMLAKTEPERACREYEEKIDKAGGIYLQVLGIGENGHIGFVEPNADMSMNAPTSIYDLTLSTRQANARFFGDDVNKVPENAISMGLGRIMKAKHIILLANGPHPGQGLKKVAALSATGYGNVTPAVPASILQEHPDTTFFLTEESAQAIGMHWKNFWRSKETAASAGSQRL